MNEDRVVVLPGLVVLADGIGGHEGGGLAAHAAVTAAAGALLQPVSAPTLQCAFQDAWAAVQQVRHRHPRLAHAGCTLTVVALGSEVVDDTVRGLVGHVGDSPAFLLRDGGMELLTAPHTMAERSGSGRPDDPAPSRRHVLTRSLGSHGPVEPDLYDLELHPGDRVLVASDGITSGPDPREVERLAAAPGPVEQVIEALIGAVIATATDNVTIALLDPWAEPDQLLTASEA